MAFTLVIIWTRLIYSFAGFRKMGFSLRIITQILKDMRYFAFITFFIIISLTMTGKFQFILI